MGVEGKGTVCYVNSLESDYLWKLKQNMLISCGLSHLTFLKKKKKDLTSDAPEANK